VRKLVRLLGIAALVLTTLGAPAASADPNTIDGGCFVIAIDLNSLTNFVTTGLLGDVSVTRDDAGNPIDAKVTCWIQINGVEVPDTRLTATGAGVQVGLNEVGFVLVETDALLVCERVAYGDATTATTCSPAPTELVVPPQQIPDAVYDTVHSTADSSVCPALAAQAGSYPGGLVISPTGDVSVDDPMSVQGIPVYDCPPYRQRAATALVVIGPVRT
jgi:hypothetical protein